MVIGTQGLSSDEELFSRPSHDRKVAAICNWLNKQYGQGGDGVGLLNHFLQARG